MFKNVISLVVIISVCILAGAFNSSAKAQGQIRHKSILKCYRMNVTDSAIYVPKEMPDIKINRDQDSNLLLIKMSGTSTHFFKLRNSPMDQVGSEYFYDSKDSARANELLYLEPTDVMVTDSMTNVQFPAKLSHFISKKGSVELGCTHL
jgi:hypothetical protein